MAPSESGRAAWRAGLVVAVALAVAAPAAAPGNVVVGAGVGSRAFASVAGLSCASTGPAALVFDAATLSAVLSYGPAVQFYPPLTGGLRGCAHPLEVVYPPGSCAFGSDGSVTCFDAKPSQLLVPADWSGVFYVAYAASGYDLLYAPLAHV